MNGERLASEFLGFLGDQKTLPAKCGLTWKASPVGDIGVDYHMLDLTLSVEFYPTGKRYSLEVRGRDGEEDLITELDVPYARGKGGFPDINSPNWKGVFDANRKFARRITDNRPALAR